MAGDTPELFLVETMAGSGGFVAGYGEAGGPGQCWLVEGNFFEGRERVLQETHGMVIVDVIVIVFFGSEQYRRKMTQNRRI